MNKQVRRSYGALGIASIFLLLSTPAAALVCGDSEPDPGEQCDDGNQINGDGCDSSCQVESGFMCTDAIAGEITENVLIDGSFEDGNVGGEWASIFHSLFGANLICDDACFGVPFAADSAGNLTSGNYVLVAGGSFSGNSTGNATHAPVSIPADATTLEFQWSTLASGPDGDPCAGATDGLSLEIGGTQVWSNLDGPVTCTNVNPYQRVVIDLAAAAGGPYQDTTVGFEFLASATGIPPNVDLTNVMLDDVSVNRPLDSPIPPVPSSCTTILDTDGDGIPDVDDNCPVDPNPLQENFDGDAQGDACDLDDDNDGVNDPDDAFPFDPTESSDNDGDGTGDNADPDDDNDGQSDTDEVACGSDPLDDGSLSPDNDFDNLPDCVDPDDDNDGIDDGIDNCPIDPNPGQEDFDMDGIGDACDPDIDGDQVANGDDVCAATVIPEGVPTSSRGLGKNRWTLDNLDGSFTQGPPQSGSTLSFSTTDTGGCSCEQIIVELGLGKGHSKFGCSNSAMMDWLNMQ